MNKIATLGLTALFSAIVLPAVAKVSVEPPPQSCEARFDWPDDPVAHVVNGLPDGSFDYDFPGAAIDNITGEYIDGAQSVSWELSYDADHYLVGASVSGDASLSSNGDYEATLTTITTDSLGQAWEETVFRTRTSCKESRVLDPAGLALAHEGQWVGDSYSYEEQRPLANNRALTGLIADVSGSLYPDGSSEAVAVYYQGGQEASTTIIVKEERNLDGERWIEMQLDSLDASRESSTYVSPDGTATKTGYFGYDPRRDYGTTLDYAGHGTGWVLNGDYELYCHLDIGDVCTRSCWDLGDIEELEEEYEDQEIEWEFEYGDYIDDLPPSVDNFCKTTLFENYAITPF